MQTSETTDLHPPAVKRKRPAEHTIPSSFHDFKNLVLQTVYYLNSTKSKSVCIGYNPNGDFESVVQFNQVGKKSVTVSQSEWVNILNCKEEATLFFYKGEKHNLTSGLAYANYFGKRHLVIKKSFNLNWDEWDALVKLYKLIDLFLQRLSTSRDKVRHFLATKLAKNITDCDFERLELEMVLITYGLANP